MNSALAVVPKRGTRLEVHQGSTPTTGTEAGVVAVNQPVRLQTAHRCAHQYHGRDEDIAGVAGSARSARPGIPISFFPAETSLGPNGYEGSSFVLNYLCLLRAGRPKKKRKEREVPSGPSRLQV